MVVKRERQYNLDLLKALAIICMVICHAIFQLGRSRPGYENDFLYILGDEILGGYMVVAHGFMFAMGVGMIYSRRNAPADLIVRGIKIFILAYVLNFCRYGAYYLTYDIVNDVHTYVTLIYTLGCDILQFAGLALIATGIFKKLKLQEFHMFAIGLILSMIGTTAASHIDAGNQLLNILFGLFVYTQPNYCNFNFCSWYLFVGAGLLFGKILQGPLDKDKLYKVLLIVSSVIALLYILGTLRYGMYFLSVEDEYYAASPMEAFGLLSIDFFFLSAFYFLLKKVDVSKFKLMIEMSGNITSIYCIHWCILGATDFFFCFMLGMVPSYAVMYAFGVVNLVVSFLLARLYKSWKTEYIKQCRVMEA